MRQHAEARRRQQLSAGWRGFPPAQPSPDRSRLPIQPSSWQPSATIARALSKAWLMQPSRNPTTRITGSCHCLRDVGSQQAGRQRHQPATDAFDHHALVGRRRVARMPSQRRQRNDHAIVRRRQMRRQRIAQGHRIDPRVRQRAAAGRQQRQRILVAQARPASPRSRWRPASCRRRCIRPRATHAAGCTPHGSCRCRCRYRR